MYTTKFILKQCLPPFLVAIYRKARYGRATIGTEVVNEDITLLKSRYAMWQGDADQGSFILRPGVAFEAHPDSRGPMEAFCWRYPEMVAEMDQFIAKTQDCHRLLDIGALHGVFSLAFTAGAPGRRAVAVEPSPLALQRLLYNRFKNPNLDITCLDVAVTDRDGPVEMWYSWEHAIAARPAAGDGSQNPTSHQLTVNGQTGDQLCDELDFRPDVIKIDVEGHEAHVLDGLRNTLVRDKPLVFLELHPDLLSSHGSQMSAIISLIEKTGYQIADAYGKAISPLELHAVEDVHRFVLSPPVDATSNRTPQLNAIF